jgi:DNA-directed RNA polymerase specialized sigma24 family protein
MAETSGGGLARYVEQVYDEHHSTLRYYFQRHLGDASAADACARETFRRFYDYAAGGGDEIRASARARLMRIAFAVCTERAAGASTAPAVEARAAA